VGLYFHSCMYLRDVHRGNFTEVSLCSSENHTCMNGTLKHSTRNCKNAVTQKTQVNDCWTYVSASSITCLVTSSSSRSTGEKEVSPAILKEIV
jgi:hypothetical protein